MRINNLVTKISMVTHGQEYIKYNRRKRVLNTPMLYVESHMVEVSAIPRPFPNVL